MVLRCILRLQAKAGVCGWICAEIKFKLQPLSLLKYLSMDYSISQVDLRDPVIELELRRLIMLAFETADMIQENHLQKNISSNASQPSFFLAAIENGKIIGCNGFIANDFTVNGQKYVCYQSCWTAVHPDHQGKKIFVNIINEGKKILKERGAGFLFGIANNKSHAIFVNKLGFVETPAMISRIPNVPFFKQFFLANKKMNRDEVAMIDEEQVKEYKIAQYPDKAKVIRYKESWLWGRLSRKKKYGINIPYFEVGGVQLADERDLGPLMSEVFGTTRAWFIQVISCQSNTFNVLIKNWKPANMNGFVVFDLNTPASKHFNVMIGAIDVF